MQPAMNLGQVGTTGCGSVFSGNSPHNCGWCQHSPWPVESRCSRMPARSFFTSAMSCSRDSVSRSASMSRSYAPFRGPLRHADPIRTARLTNGHRPRPDIGQACTNLAFGDFRIVSCLRAKPITVRQPEKPAQPQVRVCGDRPLAGHDVPNPLRRHADLLCKPVLGNPHGLQKLLGQELTGGHRIMLAHKRRLSMVINDLHILSVMAGPSEADAPLIIDPDAVLPQTVAPQSLQSIAGRNAQVIEARRDLQLAQLAASHDRDTLKAPDARSAREGFGVGTPKRSDHEQ